VIKARPRRPTMVKRRADVANALLGPATPPAVEIFCRPRNGQAHVIVAPDDLGQALRKPGLPRQMIGAGVEPDEMIADAQIFGQGPSRQPIIGCTTGATHDRELLGT